MLVLCHVSHGKYYIYILTMFTIFIEMLVHLYTADIANHCQVFPQEAPNSTNIDEVIKKASDNDSELTDINLNNIKYISDEKWANLFKVDKNYKRTILGKHFGKRCLLHCPNSIDQLTPFWSGNFIVPSFTIS